MDKKVLQVPAILNKFESKADKTVKLTFTTLEGIPADLLALLLSWQDNHGFLNYAIREIEFEDLTDLPKIDTSKAPGVKPKSVLMRQVIYKLHVQNGGTKENFQPYYNKTMDKLTKFITDKLED
jgi:hypothetical protein